MSNYGTTTQSNGAPPAPAQGSEEAPLLGGPGKPKNIRQRFSQHMDRKVSRSWADLLLLFGYIITGLLDSSSISIWGAFVSMQTGNTIYLGLGLSDPSAGTKWIKSLISIASFCAGSFVFAGYHRWLAPRKRWVLFTSYLIQFLFIVVAATIVTLGPDAPKDDSLMPWHVAVPLAALAFQSSGQAVTSRVLQYGGLTSVVLTSNYCDLFGDPNILAAPRENVERNRRAVAPILLLGGAVAGGFFSHSVVGLTGALWTAAALKAGIVVAWLFWEAEEE